MALQPQPTILLVTNDDQLRYLITRYSQQIGCRLLCADTKEHAQNLIAQEQPALLLVNLLGWPEDGWLLVRQLRRSEAAAHPPLAVISGIIDEARARAEGVVYCLWQPVMYSDFRAALATTGIYSLNSTMDTTNRRDRRRRIR